MTTALLPLQVRLWSGTSPRVEQAAGLICLIPAGAVLFLYLAPWPLPGMRAGDPRTPPNTQ